MSSSSRTGMAASRRPPVDELRSTGFKHNARMGMALAPCAALMLGMGGKPVSATLTVGLMISYILDSLLLKRAAFFGVWGSLFAAGIAFFVTGINLSSSSWALQGLGLLVLMELIFLIGVWASLQFRWLQLENPSVVIALERLLFATTPIVAGACQTWGIVAAAGVEHAAFYLMAVQFVLYWLFSLPRTSSFKSKPEKSYGGQIPEESLLIGPLEGCLHTLMLLFLPLALHLGIHHRRLGSANAIAELVLLFFVPLLFQLYASTKGALWWLAKDHRQLDHFRLVNGAIALVAVILSLEVRVVFFAFHQYIQIPPPFNYLLVTLGLLGGAAAVGLFLLGRVGNAPLTALLLVAALSSSLVLGMPLKFLPAPIISAAFLGHYLASRNLGSYFLFAVSASVSVTWFVFHNYWSLSIWVGGSEIKSICKLLIASASIALAVPGLSTLPGKARYLTDISLIGHAALVCNLENKLYNYPGIYYGYTDDVIYPSYAVVLSTTFGLLVTRRLAANNFVTSLGAWVIYCLYASKLGMLLLSSRTVLWSSVVLLLAVSPPVLLYKQKGKTGSRMKPWQGIAHAVVILAAVFWCQSTIIEALEWSFGRRPSDSVILGSMILLAGFASAPIVVQHFNHLQAARRSLVLVLATGLLFMLLQPPLPWSFSRRTFYVREIDYSDDEAIYGGIAAVPTWSTWLLLATAITTLAALSSALPVQHFVTLRFFYAIGVGANLGIYIAARYFPELVIIGVLLVVAMVSASLFLVFVLLPSASSPRFVPWLFGLLVSLLPVMYLLEGQLRGGWDQTGGDGDEKLVSILALRGARSSLLGLYAAIFMLIALVIKLQLASILREKGGVHTGGGGAGFVPKHRLLQQQRASHMSPLTVKKLSAEGAWMPAVGNIATIGSFLLCIVLNRHLTGGSDRAVLFLAPILLLLNQDTNLVTGFGDRQRYLPLCAAVSIYLAISSAIKVWGEVWHGHESSSWGMEMGGAGVIYAAKNTVLLAMAIPSHAVFNLFLWNQARASDMALLVTSPLNAPAIVAADVGSIRGLALLGVIYALLQFMISRRIRIAGMKYI
ncbi:uncharacterized protein LOC9649684 [Selaginella moellendorffii]|nr:uncharacterized protein LOC9649684 [Selaginella moellendorffii]|eukprot:XP_002985306.2 uncharacterized protein LOC9649684 [Selaginella moellendorffii]